MPLANIEHIAMEKKSKFDLEPRLIKFSSRCIRLYNGDKNSFVIEHLSKQLTRSATSAALNYGEVQGASSERDFIHKMSIVLKELKESRVNLKIQKESQILRNEEALNDCLAECEELVAIFAKSIHTAKVNLFKKEGK